MNEWHWIGLNDLETEGRWVWVNNQTLDDTKVKFWHKIQFGKSEPDNWTGVDPSGEDCAVVKNDLDSLDSWLDVSCKRTYKFICEKKF
ncbi:alpha-N-acetylgalactosamine-specific lectin-like [Danio aesculapii]|uniref:alpha-N-acetylgalactosamine-specific lectin-like n=1 Tax=Danio aesculapii TaxID=1142201 RepID=UPI0024BFFBF7|nr:alpha-N-acetylgalactosamine-specific lectin-like [Danio aesculapii]